MSSMHLRIILSLTGAVLLAACGGEESVDNGTCSNVGCHSQIEQISTKHDCVSCHGGDDTKSAIEESHPQYTPTLNTGFKPEFPLRNKGWNWTSLFDKSIEVNGVTELLFINPGDLRVANIGCGGDNPEDGTIGCHGDIVSRVKLNIHAGMQGDLSQVLYLNGDSIQPNTSSLFSGYPTVDPNFNPVTAPVGSVERLEQLPPIGCAREGDPRVAAGDLEAIPCPGDTDCCPDGWVFLGAPNPEHQSEGEIVSRMYDNNDCARCHLYNDGSKRTGDIRASGCTACHMKYANDGLSRSADESIDRTLLSRPAKHLHKGSMDDDQCAHCHNRGGRIPQGYYGRRERAGGGPTSPLNPPNASYTDLSLLGEGPYSNMHGRVFPFYIDDEDSTNDYDETPPDVHSKYGIMCVDCHVETEAHGDGHIYEDRFYEVEIKCETCHGDTKRIADGITLKGNKHSRITIKGEKVYMDFLSQDKRLEVTQIKKVFDDGSNPNVAEGCAGASHSEQLECFTCHSTWYPNCFHCHVERDDAGPERNWTDGLVRIGKLIRDNRKFISVDTFVLGVNRGDDYLAEGRYAPFIGFGTFNSYRNGLDEVYQDRIAVSTNGESYGIPWNKIHPHTNQTVPRNCDECHRSPGMVEDQAMLMDVDCDDSAADGYFDECSKYDRLRVTYGLGSRRYRLSAFLRNPTGAADIAIEYVLDRFVGADRYTINCPDGVESTDPACLGPNPVSHQGFRALSSEEVSALFSIEAQPQPRPNPKFPNKPPLGVLK